MYLGIEVVDFRLGLTPIEWDALVTAAQRKESDPAPRYGRREETNLKDRLEEKIAQCFVEDLVVSETCNPVQNSVPC